MRLFRISKVEEFFNSYPNAVDLLRRGNEKFEKYVDDPPRAIEFGAQLMFAGMKEDVVLRLESIVFSGDYEVYYYRLVE